jgi:hypothetical protein
MTDKKKVDAVEQYKAREGFRRELGELIAKHLNDQISAEDLYSMLMICAQKIMSISSIALLKEYNILKSDQPPCKECEPPPPKEEVKPAEPEKKFNLFDEGFSA